jgi:hypothetical protein
LLGGGGFFRGGDGNASESLARLSGQLQSLYGVLQEADVAPTSVVVAAVRDRLAALDPLLARWTAMVTQDLPALNQRLEAAGLAAVRP